MRRAVAVGARVVATLVVLGAASAARAQNSLTIHDLRIVEGSSGTHDVTVTVTLSAAPVSPVTVNWSTAEGSAVAGSDFTSASGSLTFNPPLETSKTLDVPIVGETLPEWSPTLPQDEVFFVDLSNPVNATILKGRATVTLLDDDRTRPGLQFVSAVSDGTASAGRNRLQWRVPPAPATPGPPTDILIAWNSGPSCNPPADSLPASAQGQRYISQDGMAVGAAGQTQIWTHLEEATAVPLVPGKPYCYSLFTIYPGPTPTADRVTLMATPFDATGAVKWAYSTGTATLVPPTVGSDAIYTVGTDGVVHAMQRGDLGGPWPTTWNPVGLGKPAHNRSPVVPMPSGWRLFVGTEGGEVHAVDAGNGSLVWSRSQSFGGTQLMPGLSMGVQATPAGLFKSFGGQNDMVLVGTATSAGNTRFFALDPATGFAFDDYPAGGDTPPGPIDNVYGMAVVDYAGNRVFFGTTGASFTLWGLDLGPSGSPNLTLSPPAWNPTLLGTGGTSGSAVLRNGRLYLGTGTGAAATVHSLRVSDGDLYSLTHGDGQVKGFLFPDRRDDRLYFSTDTSVWAVRDTGTAFVPLWQKPVTNPSIVLHRPGSNVLYVGDGTGSLLQMSVDTGDPAGLPVLLEPGSFIGAPSLDVTNDLVLVGSSSGVVYAVRP